MVETAVVKAAEEKAEAARVVEVKVAAPEGEKEEVAKAAVSVVAETAAAVMVVAKAGEETVVVVTVAAPEEETVVVAREVEQEAVVMAVVVMEVVMVMGQLLLHVKQLATQQTRLQDERLLELPWQSFGRIAIARYSKASAFKQ